MKKKPSKSDAVFRLAAGVELVPVEVLPAEVRDRLDQEWGRFALIRTRARTVPLLIDEEMAALVEGFRQPGSIPEVMIRFSQERQRDPREVLKEAFSFLQRLVAQRFLVDVDNTEDSDTEKSMLGSGDWLDDFEILRTLQRLEDMEVHQVRLADGRFGALKIGGIATPVASERLTHEAEILRFLAGDPAPEVLRVGEWKGRNYLVLEWRPGSDVLVVSEEWRHRGGTGARRGLQEICCRILETYGDLHRRGVIHGDVNARNVVIDRQDRVTLLDFEDAVRTEPDSEGGPPRDRAGVSIYFEPEHARAILAGEPSPSASEAGEQYALAALVHELLTGVPYLDFDLRWEALLGQIVEEPPATFAERGLPSWPAVEEVLLQALSKEPERRFPSVAAMAAALARAEPVQVPRPARSPSRDIQLEQLIRLATEKAANKGPWMAADRKSSSPASVYEGAAGVALALYRMSRQLEDNTLLELADVWIQRATGAVDETVAEENAVEASIFVGSAGVHLVEAMIAAARDQPDRQSRALERSLRCVNEEVDGVDLYDGRSSRLLTLCFLLDQCKAGLPVDREGFLKLGGRALDSLWTDLEEPATIADTFGDLGMAHGWGGVLYATLRWCQSSLLPPPPELGRRLAELADQAVPIGRGLMWPWRLPLGETRGPQFTAGWCNGSAGYVFLWTTAARVLGNDSFLEQAEGAAWNAWESAQRDGTLCCGLVGRAYSLLDLFEVTGERLWLDRARDLAEIATREGVFDSSCPEGLFQGELGLALLAADLRRPSQAWFPLLVAEPGSCCEPSSSGS